MEEFLIIEDSCIGCGQCVKVCIRRHLTVVDGKAKEVESEYRCFRCGHCESVCPKGAIRLRYSDEEPQVVSGPPVSSDDLYALFRQRRSQRWFDRPCNQGEISQLLESARYSPTAENSQAVEFAVIDERYPEFMELCASILRQHTGEHLRLAQFVDYVDSGMKGTNNPFTWEGRQLIIAFARLPIDAIIAMEQIDLMSYSMGLGGFHSRWIMQASEYDPDRFMEFFPDVSRGLKAHAVFVIGHPRVKYRRTVPRDGRKVIWM